jgi:glycosyltransferase involved in cell wall biosynthesis
MTSLPRTISGAFDRARKAYRINRICRRLPKARPNPPPGDGFATVIGLLRSPTGIGEGARLNATALGSLGYSVGLLDVGEHRKAQRTLAMLEGPGQKIGDIGGPLIVHLNPPAMLYALHDMLNGLGRRRIIGNWVWEAPIMPPIWHRALEFLHEVWAPSRFVADAVATAGAKIPIRVVPYAVRPSQDVAPMAIAPGKLLYVTMFSYNSGFKRKNPAATIKAFKRAFGDRDDVHLLVKAQGLPAKHAVAHDELVAAIGSAANISILGRDLTIIERDALIARADVLVSLHRSEGFGLTMAEAMLVGKAVMATNWSGNIDFMTPGTCSLIDYKLIAMADPDPAYVGLNAHWAEPDAEHAAAEMLRLTDPTTRAALGAAARRSARDYFKPECFAAAVGPGVGSPSPPGAASPTAE